MTAVRVDLATRRGEDALAEPVRRVRRRLDARPLARRRSRTATRWATSSCTRSTTRRAEGCCTEHRSRSAIPQAQQPLPGFRGGYGTASGAGVLLATTLFDDTGSLALSRSLATRRRRARRHRRSRARGRRRARRARPPRRRPLLADLQHRRLLMGLRRGVRRGCASLRRRARARRRGRARRRRAARARLRRGERAVRRVVLHGDDPDAAPCAAGRRRAACALTRERALGLAPELLSAGEDASFESHDGLRISARLYLPSPELGFEGPRPLVYYVHGGPQSQERPELRVVLDAARSRSSRSRGSPCSSRTRAGRPATGSTTRSASTATGVGSTGSTTSTR